MEIDRIFKTAYIRPMGHLNYITKRGRLSSKKKLVA